MKGYCVTVPHCESPDEPTLYDLLEMLFQEQRAVQKAIALNQRTLSIIERKLDDVLAERKRPRVELWYRS